MRIKTIIFISSLIFLFCTPILTLDDFLFEPTEIDEYLRPEDFDEDWRVRFIVPDSLIESVTLTSMGNGV